MLDDWLDLVLGYIKACRRYLTEHNTIGTVKVGKRLLPDRRILRCLG